MCFTSDFFLGVEKGWAGNLNFSGTNKDIADPEAVREHGHFLVKRLQLETGGFSFEGKPLASGSPAGATPLAPVFEGGKGKKLSAGQKQCLCKVGQ